VSQQNVDLLKRAFTSSPGEWLESFVHPEIDWRAIEGAPDDVGLMRGRDAYRRYIDDWRDLFDDFTNEIEEIIDVDDERVIAVQRARGRGKQGGVEVDLRYAVVYTIRDGKCVHGREYATREEALESVGMLDSEPSS
jgi:ketosteroid isomerase-like protein